MSTNIEKIKAACIGLLKSPLLDEEKDSLFLSHPVFENRLIWLTDNHEFRMFDLYGKREDLETAVRVYTDEINRKLFVQDLFLIIRRPYRLFLFKLVKDYLSYEDYAKMLAFVWNDAENPNQDANVSISDIIGFFEKADKKHLMTFGEYVRYNDLPETFVVYRGVAKGRARMGLSWTQNIEKANRYSKRFGDDGYVLKGLAKKINVLAYFNEHGQDQIVIDPKTLREP